MKKRMAFLLSALMTANLFTVTPVFAEEVYDAAIEFQDEEDADSTSAEIQDPLESEAEESDVDVAAEDENEPDNSEENAFDTDVFSDRSEFIADQESDQLKAAPGVEAKLEADFGSTYQKLHFSDNAYLNGISEILVNNEKWEAASSKYSVFRRKAYYADSTDNSILFDGCGNGMLTVGDVLTIKNTSYQELVLQVKGSGNDFGVEPYDPDSGNDKEGPSDGQNTLYVRLNGYFESALTGQQKYDAISGASTSVSTNKNSNVIVEAAVVPDGTVPGENDWKPLHDAVNVNTKKTKVNIDTEACGMSGVYSIYDSSLSLSGVPDKPGSYAVSVTVADENGRIATSNEILFKVYSRSEKLSDCLRLENAQQTADGKYMYDMEPWAIAAFGGENETVTVPAQIKAWYGSHTSGTYGELGYSVSESESPTQTLIVPSGCDLTLVNMKIFSSVRIIVQKCGRLCLRDSSVHGLIEVMDGGRISVNYDNYGGSFLTGASVNGQLILNDGAILESSLIYSNTNFLANGSEVRHNTAPVVLVKGNAVLEGEVYIRGDEAATGKDPNTQKSYSGQPAMKISGGTLAISDNGVLGVFGGGRNATTSVGGAALILDHGTVKGNGKLIAVGGNGSFDDGGNGVSGNGSIETSSAWLEGGSAIMSKTDSVSGKAYEDSVEISDKTVLKAVAGRKISGNYEDATERQWNDITKKPNLTLYEITDPDKKPDSDEKTEPDKKPDSGKKPDSDNKQEETVKPGTVSAVKAVSSGYNKIKISWKKAANTSGYVIERKNGSRWQKIADIKTPALSYVQSNSKKYPVQTGHSYTYRIRAYRVSGGKYIYGEYSKSFSGKALLSAPTLKAAKKASGIQLKWKKTAGASGYVIYRSTTGKKWTKVATTAKTTVMDKKASKGKTYRYRIRAYRKVNGKKVYGKWSGQVKIKR